MAWTVTKQNTVFGNKKVVMMTLDADAATQTIETGLSVIEHLQVNDAGSMATQVGHTVIPNKSASGVAANGSIGCSGFTSGDTCYVMVFGR